MSAKRKNSPIICFGMAGVIGMAALTGVTANTVINKANDNADKAYAEAVIDAQNAQMEAWRAEQDRLAALEQNKDVSDKNQIVITDYTVDDIIIIDGEWYVISSIISSGNDDTSNPPMIIDPSDNITVDGNDYSHIDNPDDIEKPIADGDSDKDSNGTDDSITDDEVFDATAKPDDTDNNVDVDNVDDIPYTGAEYVTIDVDGNMVYLVQKNDTLTKVSNLTGYSIQELAEYNHIENVNLIYIGQSIKIPASQEDIDYVTSLQNADN